MQSPCNTFNEKKLSRSLHPPLKAVVVKAREMIRWFPPFPKPDDMMIRVAAVRCGFLAFKCKVNAEKAEEAFSSVAMAFAKELDIGYDKMNVNGGAVALGHPLACSGARIVATLINVLEQNDAETGCATLCNGGGGASAIVIKRV